MCAIVLSKPCSCSHGDDWQRAYEVQFDRIYDPFLDWISCTAAKMKARLEATYGPLCGYEKTKTKNGWIKILRHRSSGAIHIVKWSKIRYKIYQPILPHQILEAVLYKICSTDGHPGLVRLEYFKYSIDQCVLATKYAQGGTLHGLIARNAHKARLIAENIFKTICYSLDYLHNHLNIAHLDLTLDNIFLDSHYNPTIGHFGNSTLVTFPSTDDNRACGELYTEANSMSNQLQRYVSKLNLYNYDNIDINLARFSTSFSRFEELQCMGGNGVISYDILLSAIDSVSYQSTYGRTVYQHVPGGTHALDIILPLLDNILTHHPTLCMDKIKQDLVCYVKGGQDPQIYSLLCQDRSRLHVNKCRQCVSTIEYIAPEVSNAQRSTGMGYNPFAADIYSLGVILYALAFQMPLYSFEIDGNITRPSLFFIENSRNVSHPVRRQLIRSGVTHGVNPTLLSLLEEMLCWDPQKRITIKRVIEKLPELVIDCNSLRIGPTYIDNPQ